MDFLTSTTSDNFISLDTLQSDKSSDKNNLYCYCWIFIVIIIIIIIYFWWNSKNNKLEHMTAGTLTQMFAVDAQNKALNGDVNELATGNYNLYWGQPSRVASTYPNRGQLLPATMISRVAAEQNGNNPNKLDINLNYDQTYAQQLDGKAKKLVNYLDNTEKKNNNFIQQNCGENCYTNPQACGNGAGGYRLGSDFVEPSTAKPFVSLQGNLYMPDQYVGSYWIAPEPDIMKPLPVVANGMYPLNNSLNTN